LPASVLFQEPRVQGQLHHRISGVAVLGSETSSGGGIVKSRLNHARMIVGAIAVVLLMASCDLIGDTSAEEEDNTSTLVQYTPDQADWSTFFSKPLAVSSITAHDPDSIGWLSEPWPTWDGTVFDPSTMTRSEFHDALFPNGNGDQLIGLREVFYEHEPFADNENPTKAEVDEWHRIAINHLRALVGYDSADRQVQPDHDLFLRAHWGDERKFTDMWDAEYPGETGSAYGPCDGTNSHCGATFLPDAEDQEPYLPAGHSAVTNTGGGAEGIFSGSKSNIPWSIKWVRSFSSTLATEGFWGGHTGPWFHREKFGFSFWDNDPGNGNSNAILRAKWGGNLMPSLYDDPDA